MLQRILLLAILWMVFVGCDSEERKAYNYAKEEGKSDFYAKAYAEQIAEGKGKIYAEAYAFALEKNRKDTKYDDKMKEIFAKIYAEQRYGGRTVEYAVKYAIHYCKIFPVAMKQERGERFVHEVVKYFIDTEDRVTKQAPHLSPKYIRNFSITYALERAMGTGRDEAVDIATDYANSKN